MTKYLPNQTKERH